MNLGPAASRRRGDERSSFRIVLGGLGGQGIVFAHRVLSQCAASRRENITGAETLGMSQRGGSVASHLKIGEACAPLIRQGTADLLLAFEEIEARRLLPYLRRGGTAIVNSNNADFLGRNLRTQIEMMGISIQVVDADEIARRCGSRSSANMGLLGFACGCPAFPFSPKELQKAIVRVGPGHSLESNLKAFDEGLKAASQSLCRALQDSVAIEEDKKAAE